jgi:hypothetical protein
VGVRHESGNADPPALVAVAVSAAGA